MWHGERGISNKANYLHLSSLLSTSILPSFNKNMPWVISNSMKPGVTIVILISGPTSTRNISKKLTIIALLVRIHL